MKPVPKTICYLLLALGLVGASWYVRARVISERPLSGELDNEDASSHVLLTCKLYDRLDPALHYYVPPLSYPGAENQWYFGKDAKKGLCVDEHGYYYYVSFPPTSFLVPYGIFKLFGLEFNIVNIRIYTLILQLISAGVFSAITCRLLLPRLHRPAAPEILLFAFLTFFFADELLKSYTLSYWAQHLYTPFLLIFCYQAGRGKYNWLYYTMLAAGCLIEWTAYLAAGAAVVLCYWRYRVSGDASYKRHLWYSVLTTALCGFGLTLWLTIPTGLFNTLYIMLSRIFVRSYGRANSGHFLQLPWNYALSLGAGLIVLTLVVLVFRYREIGAACRQVLNRTVLRNERLAFSAPLGFFLMLLGACCENLLLLQHAMIFSFDRIKVVALVCFALAYFVFAPRRLSSIQQAVLASGVGLQIVLSLYFFYERYDKSQGDFSAFAYHSNTRLGEYIRTHTPPRVKPICLQVGNLPALNLYAERNVPILYLNFPTAATPAEREAIIQTAIEDCCRGLDFDAAYYFYFDEQKNPTYKKYDLPKSAPAAPQ